MFQHPAGAAISHIISHPASGADDEINLGVAHEQPPHQRPLAVDLGELGVEKPALCFFFPRLLVGKDIALFEVLAVGSEHMLVHPG